MTNSTNSLEENIEIIKQQFINIIRDKRYNTSFLEIEDIGNSVIKIYYNKQFIKYLNLNKFNMNDFQRPQSQQWIKYKTDLIEDITKSYTSSKQPHTICLIPVWKNHNLLNKCISSLQNQTSIPRILLLVSSEHDVKFSIMYNLEFIRTPREPMGRKLQNGLDYIKNNCGDCSYIMICKPTDYLTKNWITEGCKLLSNRDIIGKTSTILINKFSDDVFLRTIDNRKIHKMFSTKVDYVIGSGRMIRKTFLEKIKWKLYNTQLKRDVEIQSFKNIVKLKPKVGIIINSNIVRVNLDKDFKLTIRLLKDKIYNNITSMSNISQRERNIITKLKLSSSARMNREKRELDKMNLSNSSKRLSNRSSNKSRRSVNKNIKFDKTSSKVHIIKKTSRKKSNSSTSSLNRKRTTASNKRIARKYTQTNTLFTSEDENMFLSIGIAQFHLSKYLIIWKERIKKAYNLEYYYDPNKPALFYGLFNDTDVAMVKNHKSKKYILWDGKDLDFDNGPTKNNILNIIESIRKVGNIMHIAASNEIQNVLGKYNIVSYLTKINFSLGDKNFSELSRLGNKIIVYNGNKHGEERCYGRQYYETLMRRLPEFKFLFTNKLKTSYDNIHTIYKECFVGIRLSTMDGISQFSTDLGMLGIPVIHNGIGYNCVKWRNIDDVVNSIRLFNECRINYNNLLKSTYNLYEKKNVIKNSPICRSLVLKYPFKDNAIYSIKMTNLKTKSDDIKLYLFRDFLEELPDSNLYKHAYLNFNYIDTKLRRNFDYIIIKSKNYDEFSFDELMIVEKNINEIKNEAETSKMLDVKEVKLYKKNINKKYNVACILDTFSFKCFKYDLNLYPIKKNNWKYIIKKYNIDYFLFESAWHGNNGIWDEQITSYETLNKNSEIRQLMVFLKRNGIPKVFYNKEDPWNFNHFSSFAKEFNGKNDCIVTTDENMISEYKKLGCKNILSFPFCCQPVIHNPIGKSEDNDKNIIFPCAYYKKKYPERCKIMDKMIDMHIDNVDIYDRRFIFHRQIKQIWDLKRYEGWYDFPDKYNKNIKGSLSYEQVLSLYRKYKCVMNVDTETKSKTMFARRATEASGSALPLISDRAIGIKTVFGDDVVYFDDKEKVNKLLTDEIFRKKTGNNLYKKVMNNYTYRHLIEHFMLKIPKLKNKVKKENLKDSVMCMIFLEDMGNLPKFMNFMNEYNYVIISNSIKTSKLNAISYDKIKSIDKTFNFYVIMNEWCDYKPNYVKNMILPDLYTDAEIFGKGCYFYQNEKSIVSKELEHHYTNRLNINTLVIKPTNNTSVLFNGNMIDNFIEYMKIGFTGKNMYSADRDDFIDNYDTYHYFDKNEIELECIRKPVREVQYPVIMCTYNRIELINKTIECLNRQTFNKFALYIWNNSPGKKKLLLKNIANSEPNFPIYIYNSDENVGGIGRFYLINHLIKTINYKYSIFIDDDQILGEKVIENFVKTARPKCSYNWYGRKFIRGKPYYNVDDDNNNKKPVQVKVKFGNLYDYGGTGGMIIDTDIFKDEDFFKSLPKEYKFVEDLWMSYYGTVKLGYRFLRIKQDIVPIRDQKDQCNAIWDVKNLLLEYCRQSGWDV